MSIERGATVHGFTFLRARPKPAPATAPKQLTVGELIELLKGHSPEMLVHSGAFGKTTGVMLHTFGDEQCLEIMDGIP